MDSDDDAPVRPTPQAVPRATYRLQLTPDFGFIAAAEVAHYLEALGVSHAYCSPYLQAAPGSTHGYDVVDHSRVNEELGGAEGHRRFIAALSRSGLGQVIDIVPNHMAVGHESNRWWWDVLRHGPSSRFASWFDVDWTPSESKLRNRVLLPVLGDQYGVVLHAGDLVLHRDGSEFTIRYHEHLFPASPRSIAELVSLAAARTGDARVGFVADQLAALPPAAGSDDDEAQRRLRDTTVLLGMLSDILEQVPNIGDTLDDLVRQTNADPEALHAVLEGQNYRLASWRTAATELDYRRFFDVNALAGLRVENPLVFDEVHRLALQWITDGSVQGLRVDHPDGLLDPTGYFKRLAAEAPDAWIVVEKILEAGESMRSDWPVAGTTGYEFLNVLNGVFVDPAGETSLTETYVRYTNDTATFAQVVTATKDVVLKELLATDVERLTNLLVEVGEQDINRRDYTRRELRECVRAIANAFAVYRTYVRAGTGADATDRQVIDDAVAGATSARPDVSPELLRYVAGLLLANGTDGADQPAREFAYRFQQLTGPVMAKAVEDTAFYRYTRLVSLNEVGGDPSHFAISVDEFHTSNSAALRTQPNRMTTTSTHDTKRSEDVRLRINLLAEIPDEWRDTVLAWGKRCERLAAGVGDRAVEYLLHQTMVGAYPLGRERAHTYLTKAMREAKTGTSWLAPDAPFEHRFHELLDDLFDDPDHRDELERFALPLIRPGRISAISQKLIALTSPGVPDLYQGSELWTDDLVDPDNRRPVDFGARRALHDQLRERHRIEPSAQNDDMWGLDDPADAGAAKMWTVLNALDVRLRYAECFTGPDASYAPLAATGAAAGHILAFARGGRVVTVAPRLPLRLERSGGWRDTTVTLPPGLFTNVLSGQTVAGEETRIDDLLACFPAALLVGAS